MSRVSKHTKHALSLPISSNKQNSIINFCPANEQEHWRKNTIAIASYEKVWQQPASKSLNHWNTTYNAFNALMLETLTAH